MDFLALFVIFTLACVVGYYVVWGVTPALHTPLMAVTNAISGIVVVAAIFVVGHAETLGVKSIGTLAIILASINIFGGFAITNRMLALFKTKPQHGGKK